MPWYSIYNGPEHEYVPAPRVIEMCTTPNFVEVVEACTGETVCVCTNCALREQEHP
jgi:hypothetical protein